MKLPTTSCISLIMRESSPPLVPPASPSAPFLGLRGNAWRCSSRLVTMRTVPPAKSGGGEAGGGPRRRCRANRGGLLHLILSFVRLYLNILKCNTNNLLLCIILLYTIYLKLLRCVLSSQDKCAPYCASCCSLFCSLQSNPFPTVNFLFAKHLLNIECGTAVVNAAFTALYLERPMTAFDEISLGF